MEDDSFANYDKNAIGNIMQKPLRDILERYNDQCLLLCDESKVLDLETAMLVATPEEFSFEKKVALEFNIELAKLILHIRHTVKEQYPILSPQNIIDTLPMPRSSVEASFYCDQLAAQSPYRHGKQLSEFFEKLGCDIMDSFLKLKEKVTSDYIDNVLCVMYALAYLRTEDGQKFIKDRIFGNKLYLLKLQGIKCSSDIEALERFMKNDKTYPCGEDNGIYQKY